MLKGFSSDKVKFNFLVKEKIKKYTSVCCYEIYDNPEYLPWIESMLRHMKELENP